MSTSPLILKADSSFAPLQSFDVITEISESVRTAKWTGECFVYTNANHRIQYLVGEQTHTINHTDAELYLLGYLPQHGRVYLVDKVRAP